MVGPTAQLVSLTLHVNARLRGIETAAFQNSTTQYCERIGFLQKTVPPDPAALDPNGHVVADDPDVWLASLRGVRRALVVHEVSNDPRLSDRMSSGFVGGGGKWYLCLDRGESFECWEGWWKVGDRKAADRRIWQVHYARVVESYTMDAGELAAATESVEAVSEMLRGTLVRIEAFARRHDLAGFAEAFRTAQGCLDSTEPLAAVFHKDIGPSGVLPLSALRVLAASQVAWVFGGMGSWNDMGFEGEDGKEYAVVSDELFRLLNQAICAAANQSAPS